MIGNGNFAAAWSSFSTSEQSDYEKAGALAGARFALDKVVVDTSIKSKISLQSDWDNTGVTPAYEPFRVFWQLRSSSGQVVWEAASGLDFEKFLPGTRSHTDSFTLPSLTPGTYSLALSMRDPTGVRTKPWVLALQGRGSDGAYVLGSVQVP
jgi:hypothetical protein